LLNTDFPLREKEEVGGKKLLESKADRWALKKIKLILE